MAISKWVGGVIILVAFIFAGRSSQAFEETGVVDSNQLHQQHQSLDVKF